MPAINNQPMIPTARLPDTKVTDVGKVRLGESTITGIVPAPRLPDRQVADTGAVRVGESRS